MSMSLTTETPDLGLSTKHDLGQFFTPTHVADFMASLLKAHRNELSLLDAGAGTGGLTAAVVRRLCATEPKPKKVTVAAYEVDRTLIEGLERTLDRCKRECRAHDIEFHSTVINVDFVEAVVSMLERNLFSADVPHFNAAIVNPPYRKLRSDSNARLRLRSIGIETSNFYSAFVALICRLLADGGELVAITPRSFCNGPYFKQFRSEMLNSMSVQRLHLFDSRSAAFDKDNVLQENLIVHAIKGKPKPKKVILSRSTGRPGDKVTEQCIPFSQVVSPKDPEQFIHVPIGQVSVTIRENLQRLDRTLEDLKLNVSTGRVVDFRARSFLRNEPGVGTAPLIYPGHFKNGTLDWPKASRKPNAIVISDHTRDLLVRRGTYVLVKRFTSKEERRRVVACIYDPSLIRAPLVAFENHLNYFHADGRGLDMNLAKGLSAFLNSTLVDSYFRQFSGHTQVNATDLRKLNYPSRTVLHAVGQKIEYPINQQELDTLIESEIFNGN
jgi:adenine-specific DNA-methyltransferase